MSGSPSLLESEVAKTFVIPRDIRLSLLFLVPLLVTYAVPRNQYGSGNQQSVAVAPSVPAKPLHWSGVFSCTAHLDGRQLAITWRGIRFRQDGDRLTGLYTFTGNFKYRDLVVFSSSLTGQGAQLTATAVRTNGSRNFTAKMSGSRSFLTGLVMSGMSQQPVRSCTLALTPMITLRLPLGFHFRCDRAVGLSRSKFVPGKHNCHVGDDVLQGAG
jgi:hypothetical protein